MRIRLGNSRIFDEQYTQGIVLPQTRNKNIIQPEMNTPEYI